MTVTHRTEVYQYGPDRWGWECRDCSAGHPGYAHASAAETNAYEHERTGGD